MTTYLIRYLDALGRTRNSESHSFESNPAATAYARIGLVRNAIVEVWRDMDLVARLFQNVTSDAQNIPAAQAPNVLARPHVVRDTPLSEWDSESDAERTPEGIER